MYKSSISIDELKLPLMQSVHFCTMRKLSTGDCYMYKGMLENTLWIRRNISDTKGVLKRGGLLVPSKWFILFNQENSKDPKALNTSSTSAI